jgi:Fur family transcriptional regulator, zinc uptake regulator
LLKHKHNHDECIENALKAAEDICTERDTRFTPLRRRVLELVWTKHAPITAYEVLDLLSEGQKRVAPPTVYRALDFLIEEGFVHRIESLNSFVGCSDPKHRHQGHFLICRKCSNVSEMNEQSLHDVIKKAAQSFGYSYENSILEIAGICENCRK